MSNYVISAKDREILREVANKQYELSQAEKNKKRIFACLDIESTSDGLYIDRYFISNYRIFAL